MALTFTEKKKIVSEVAAVATEAHSAVAAEYHGLSVGEMTELRVKAREGGVYLRVVKNNLAKLALADTEFSCMSDGFVGPLVLAFSQEDPGGAARVLKDFAKNLSTNCRSTLIRFFSLQVMGLADGKNILLELKEAMQECDEPEQKVLQGGLDILMDVDLREYLTSASCPVKIIQGDKDSLVPIKVVSDIQGILPTCEFDIIRGAGHVPFISHQMEVIGSINSFI